ncbi:hypothetical protein [Edaphobacter aggregans]|uniref:hypothetical protein n=1 Tax=Edaphobacter aggregans TaxID=570835 RepID=UPI0012FB6686|nr:hypothetical protein [Edaphobacter aggregans]
MLANRTGSIYSRSHPSNAGTKHLARVFGITIRRQNKKPWEPAFLSIIDCRGLEKAAGANHTKWHELGHLFILTDQTRFSFQRSFCQGDKKDPEEQIVDAIAGHFEYWPPLFTKHCRGAVSFAKIENIRQELCSEASKASGLIGLGQSLGYTLPVSRSGASLQEGRIRSARRCPSAPSGPIDSQ